MPIIQPKSPEMLQAQAAAFAAEYCGYGDGLRLAQEVGAVAGEATALGILPLSERPEYALIDSRDKEYLEFLRSRQGAGYEPVQDRQQLLRAYETFAPIVDGLVEEVSGLTPSEVDGREDFLGYGRHSMAFEVELEGKPYALRVTRPKRGVYVDKEYIKSGLKTRGVPHMEQLIAISYDQGVTIAEKMPGKRLDKLTMEDLESITDEQLGGLLDTFRLADSMGLMIDVRAPNIFYDAEEGFGVIDLTDGEHWPELNSGLPKQDGATLTALGIYTFESLAVASENKEEFEDYTDLARLYEMTAQLMERFGAVCLERFSDNPALEAVKEKVEDSQTVIQRYRTAAAKCLV